MSEVSDAGLGQMMLGYMCGMLTRPESPFMIKEVVHLNQTDKAVSVTAGPFEIPADDAAYVVTDSGLVYKVSVELISDE